MATALTIHKAKIKYAAGPPRETKYGQRINVLCILPSGEEFRLWGNPGDERLIALQKGQQIEVLKDRKGYKLVDLPTDQPAPVQPAQTHLIAKPISQEMRSQVADYVTQMGQLYQFCWDSATLNLQGKAQDEESIRAAASSLFIAASKRFSL